MWNPEDGFLVLLGPTNRGTHQVIGITLRNPIVEADQLELGFRAAVWLQEENDDDDYRTVGDRRMVRRGNAWQAESDDGNGEDDELG